MGINITSYTVNEQDETIWGSECVGMTYSNGIRILRMLDLTDEAQTLYDEAWASVKPQTLKDRLDARLPDADLLLKAATGTGPMVTSPGAMADEAYYARVWPFLVRVADEAIRTGAESVQLS